MANELVWCTEDDDKVCEDCRALEGKPEGEGWLRRLPPGEGGPPPLHHACRCFIGQEEV